MPSGVLLRRNALNLRSEPVGSSGPRPSALMRPDLFLVRRSEAEGHDQYNDGQPEPQADAT